MDLHGFIPYLVEAQFLDDHQCFDSLSGQLTACYLPN